MTVPSKGRTLHLEKTLAAPPERVFAACVEADKLAEWWGPAGFISPNLELDVREGGGYRITMQPPEGEAFHLCGEFLEIETPRRLVYTFVWEEPDPDDRETVVTLTFEQAGENTRFVLDHGPFKTDARYELHRAGWTETLERLERVVVWSPRSVRAGPPAVTRAVLTDVKSSYGPRKRRRSGVSLGCARW